MISICLYSIPRFQNLNTFRQNKKTAKKRFQTINKVVYKEYFKLSERRVTLVETGPAEEPGLSNHLIRSASFSQRTTSFG